MLDYLFSIPGVLYLTGAGVVTGVIILGGLIADAFSRDRIEYLAVDRGEIEVVEVSR
ncbi:hypothetical protein [Gordonia sp. WA4-43]|uniref:hypothetical protein n=1 Tax=Gordonia sp. WA4-43 TaxID=2878678 RepID=UPI001CFAA74F|nr:hypothetical protein [Gordonia sp. WA4-43]UCZ89031.1 hypothetical protein LEL84_18525 [Gordonia sp. WA4-43]